MKKITLALFLILVVIKMGVSQEISPDNILERPLSITIVKQALPSALMKIAVEADINLGFEGQRVDKSKMVRFRMKNGTLAEALNYCLAGTNLTYKVKGGGIVILAQKPKPLIIRGKVVAKSDDFPLGQAHVVEQLYNQGTLTADNGEFELALPAGK